MRIVKLSNNINPSSIIHYHYRGEWIIFSGIIGLLIFSPFAFGSVHVWAYTIVEISLFSLLVLHFIIQLLFSDFPVLTWVKTPINWVLILFLFFIILQIIPLPSFLIALISPKTYTDKVQFLQIIEGSQISNFKFQISNFFSLAYALHPIILESLKLMTYMGMFFLVLNTVKSKKQINILIYLLIFIGLFETVYSLIFQVFTDTPLVWWWERRWRGIKDPSGNSASGTFMGSNHFAFYMEMIFALCVGFMIAQKKRRKRLLPVSNSIRAMMQRIVNWFSPESSNPKIMFLLLCSVFMGGTLLMSRSRGGILSIGIAMLMMAILFFFKKNYRKYGGMILGFCLITMIYGVHLGIQPTLEKFKDSQGLDLRLYTTRTMLPMILDYSLTGVGWGNFAYIYPRYIPKDTPEGFEGTSTSGYSHNDWVEAWTEVGFLGSILMLFAFFGYLFAIIRIWLKRNSFHAVGIGTGVIILLISTGIHSFFDFSMHVPANPLTLAAILGLGYAALHRKGNGYEESFFYKVREIPLTPLKRILISGLIISIFTIVCIAAGRHFLAEIKCPTEWNSTLKLNWSPEVSDIKKAISLNPFNSECHFRLADHYKPRRYNENANSFKESNELTIATLEKAISLNPTQGFRWYNLGELYLRKRLYESEDTFKNQWIPLIDKCFDIAIQCDPNNKYILFNVAQHWIWRSTLLSDKKEGVQKFQRLFQQVFEAEQTRWKEAVEQIWEYYPDSDIVAGIIPINNKNLKDLILQWVEAKKKI